MIVQIGLWSTMSNTAALQTVITDTQKYPAKMELPFVIAIKNKTIVMYQKKMHKNITSSSLKKISTDCGQIVD